ncbi:UPF0496 protein [Cinnamomum micranthum f. kanehirae]|uniref:UPF0496 protein n=1 Tax=Cinnamomum micranthum f. kanehirae TaxID=337451 RepID=A0A443PBK9_9MAGN|nr:UPF0496 protein [Cinnamomum micranthum f. kanehirae]
MFLLLEHIELICQMGSSASKADSAEFLRKQELVSNSHNSSSVQLHRNVRSSGGATNATVVSPDHVVDDQSCLKELTSQINKTNEQAVRSILDILESKEDIKKNLQLFDLVQEYFSNSFRMSDLCNALEDSLKRAHDRQLILRVAVQLFKEEEEIGDGANNEDKYQRAMGELKKFKDTENPFAVFAQVLEKVREQQQSLVDKLNHHNKKIKKKLLFLKVWRIVSDTILASITLTLRIVQIAVILAGMSPVASLLGTAATVSYALTKTLDSKFKSSQDELKQEMDLIGSMKMQAWVELTELNEIHDGVDRLEKQLQSLMKNADSALGGKEQAKLWFVEIEKSMDKFMKTLEELDQLAGKCSNDLKKGRLAIQDKINRY